MPTLTTAVSFSTNPAATPSYVDISSYVQSFATNRGRQFELDRMQAGTAQLLLRNQDRRFDPFNTSSPYSPNVLPNKRLKIEATWNSITYPVFTGFVEKWPQTWALSGKLATTQITVTDAFALFGQALLNVSYPAELSGARVNHVVDSVGWGSGTDRVVGTGFAKLQASALENTTALEHLLSVATSENGRLFISRAGAVTFLQRDYGTSSVVATYGDATGELHYSDLALDTAPIWNDIRLTATGGAEQAAADNASISAYFVSSKVESQYLQDEDTDLGGLASWYLFKYKQPQPRVTSMTIFPSRDPNNLWPEALGREIGDHVLVKRRPPGGGPVISQEAVIEGISHQAANSEWSTTFSLSPAEPVSGFMIIGTGVIGTGVVGY